MSEEDEVEAVDDIVDMIEREIEDYARSLGVSPEYLTARVLREFGSRLGMP